jgi:hypothetical protein
MQSGLTGSIHHRSYTDLFSVYQHPWYPEINYWLPRDELEVSFTNADGSPKTVTRTLIFVQSCRIFYADKSDDPVFLAQDPYKDLISNETLWVNLDAKAQVLACVDENEVCTHDESICQHPSVATPASLKGSRRDEFEFVRLAMNKSTIFHSIQYGLGSALNASLRIADFVSKPLGDENRELTQWIVESESLFTTSLARIPFDALDIAMGTNSNQGDLYKNIALEGTNLCNKMKIKLPAGYKNYSKWPSFWFLFVPAMLLILHLKLPFFPFEEDRKKYFHGNRMVIDGAHKLPGWLWQKLSSWRQATPDPPVRPPSGPPTDPAAQSPPGSSGSMAHSQQTQHAQPTNASSPTAPAAVPSALTHTPSPASSQDLGSLIPSPSTSPPQHTSWDPTDPGSSSASGIAHRVHASPP